mgnify:CR=1 FL=1
MAEECARVNRLALGCGPCSVHHIGPAHARRERKAAGERFAETDEVGHNIGVLAGEPLSRAAEARVDFVEHEERLVFVAEFAQQRKEAGRWNIDATTRLHGFDQNCANPAPREEAANLQLHHRQVG